MSAAGVATGEGPAASAPAEPAEVLANRIAAQLDDWQPAPSTRELRLERRLWALIRATRNLVDDSIDLEDGDTVVKTSHLETLLAFVRRNAEELLQGDQSRVL